MFEQKNKHLKLEEYLAKAYAAYVLFSRKFVKLYPYTYSVFIKLNMVTVEKAPLQFKYSLLNVSLDLLLKKDAEYLKKLDYKERIKICELLIRYRISKDKLKEMYRI